VKPAQFVVWEVIDAKGRVWFAAWTAHDALALAFYGLCERHSVQSRLL